MVGSWGTVIQFEVSSAKVLTPGSVEVQKSARFAQQDTVGLAPVYEFLGAGLSTCTLPVRLSIGQGVNPRAVIDALRTAMATGRAEALVIGGNNVFGVKSLAVIDALSESWQSFTGQGGLQVAEGTISFHEIVPRSLVPAARPVASSTVSKTNVVKRK
jgi:phage protein U